MILSPLKIRAQIKYIALCLIMMIALFGLSKAVEEMIHGVTKSNVNIQGTQKTMIINP
jgi:hypothetical protein